MQTVTPPFSGQEQLPLPRASAHRNSPSPQLGQSEMKDYAEQSGPACAFQAFINTVERLERILDQETAALREQKLIALDEFNQKKSHGLLELRRTIAGICALQFETLGLNPKPVLTRLRTKLQSNLAALQTHLHAVAAIAAIIARTIEEQESDGTYSPADSHKARQR
jgi:hypothetical protein